MSLFYTNTQIYKYTNTQIHWCDCVDIYPKINSVAIKSDRIGQTDQGAVVISIQKKNPSWKNEEFNKAAQEDIETGHGHGHGSGKVKNQGSVLIKSGTRVSTKI